MTMQTQKIFSEALTLPPIERAALIEQLLASFDQETRASVDLLWAIESESRLDAYDSGEVGAHPLEDVVKKINRP